MGRIRPRYECINTHKFSTKWDTPVLISDYVVKLNALKCPVCQSTTIYVGDRT